MAPSSRLATPADGSANQAVPALNASCDDLAPEWLNEATDTTPTKALLNNNGPNNRAAPRPAITDTLTETISTDPPTANHPPAKTIPPLPSDQTARPQDQDRTTTLTINTANPNHDALKGKPPDKPPARTDTKPHRESANGFTQEDRQVLASGSAT